MGLKTIFTSIVILLFIACGFIKDEKFSINLTENVSNSLKLGGYYYVEKIYSSDTLVSAYFLYENGIIVYAGSKYHKEFWSERHQQRLTQSKILKNMKTVWGVYKILNKNIVYERWYPGERPYRVYKKSGVVLNDSSFMVTHWSKPNGSEKERFDELYKFRAFSPKPDSTNMFIP